MTASIFQGQHPLGVQAALIENMRPACALTVSAGQDWINIHLLHPDDLLRMGEEIVRQARALAADLLVAEEAA